MDKLVELLTSNGWKVLDTNVLSKTFEKHFTMIINGQQNVNTQTKEVKIELLNGELDEKPLYGFSILDANNVSEYMAYFEDMQDLANELNNLYK